MKRLITICLLFHLYTITMGQSYLERSRFADRKESFMQVNQFVSERLKESINEDDPKFFTYFFSNRSGTPLVAIYLTYRTPYLLHDWELNQSYYLGYLAIGRDTVLFYTDMYDFIPNGVAEEFIKGFDVVRDERFDRYYYPNHWFESGYDDVPHYTFKIKRSGRLSKVDNKRFHKCSKWYERMYPYIAPPPPPPEFNE